MMTLFVIVAILMAYRASFVVLSPSYRARAALVEANLQPVFVAPLLEQVGQLKTMGANIETTSIVALREALQNTARLAESATKEFEAQYASWAVVRGEIKNDGAPYNELRRQLEQTQRLQETEIIRLREALDKAVKPSMWWDVGTQGLSFFMGVLSSILATLTWERIPALKNWWQRQAVKRFPESPPP